MDRMLYLGSLTNTISIWNNVELLSLSRNAILRLVGCRMSEIFN